MSILLADNFSYLGRKPLDGRILYETLADMAGIADSTIYEGAIAYNKETGLYYSWNADNVDDSTLGKWRELSVNGKGATLEDYKQGVDYKANTLFYGDDGRLYIAAQDFTSDDSESTVEDSFYVDTLLGNIIAFSFMPVAPQEYTFDIQKGGSDYAIGEVILTTNPTIFCEIVEVGANGEVEDVEFVEADEETTVDGNGAIVTPNQIIFGGSGEEWIPIPKVPESGDAFLLEDVSANVTVGGIQDGDTVDKDTSFTAFVKKLLTKVITPTITFTATNTGVYEIGSTVNGSHFKVVITNLPKTTSTINKIEFLVNGTIVDTELFTDGQSTYTYMYSDPITANTTVKAIVTYDDDKTVTEQGSMKFVKASYYGAVDTLNVDDLIITNLTKVVKDSKAYTWENATLADQRFCYAYPASMGNLSTIKDANNFEYINSYTKTTVAIDGEDYNVYTLTDPVTITGTKQIYG